MVITFRRPLRRAALVAAVLAIAPASHADEPPIDPIPAEAATAFERLTHFTQADPKSPFQQIQLTAVLEEPAKTPELPSKSAPAKQAPVMDSPAPRPVEYHYHYHAPAINQPAQAPVMATAQAVTQAPVLAPVPVAQQAVQVVSAVQQLPAVERPPGPIRRMVGNAAYALSHIDDTRYVSRVPRTRPVASSSSATAVHTITTTATQPVVVTQAPAQQPVFSAPPPPIAPSAQR